MKIIRCTRKLLKEAGIVVPNLDVCPSSWLESWHANLVIIDRCKCLLVTNDESFYTLFIPGLEKADFKHLKLIINEHLFKSMVYDGLYYGMSNVHFLEFNYDGESRPGSAQTKSAHGR